MMSDGYNLPSTPGVSGYTNLFIVVAWVVLLAWIFRALRSFHLLYRLNVAISTGQVRCLPPVAAECQDETNAKK